MGRYKHFNFYPEDTSYKDIEKFCIDKGYVIDKDAINSNEYPSHIRNNGDRLVFTINKFIGVRKPHHEGIPSTEVYISGYFGPIFDKETKLVLAVHDGDETKREELEAIQNEISEIKSKTDKIYASLKREFGITEKEADARRDDIISYRKEKGLDALGNPIKKGLISKIFG